LSVRHSSELGDYSLCITGTGQTRAMYDYIDAQGQWQTRILLDTQVRDGTRHPAEWNTLKVMVRGSQFWFLVNGVVIGTAQDTSRSSGSVALYVINWDNETVTYEFRNLLV